MPRAPRPSPPRSTGLTSLNLDGNNIGDEGAKAIAASLPRPHVSKSLGNNDIGAEGAKAIAASLTGLDVF